MAAAMDRLDFASGFGAVWDLIRAANGFIEDRAPWALNKAGDTEAVAGVLGDCLETLRIVALLASPVIPTRLGGAVAAPRSARPSGGPARARGGGVGAAARGLEAGEGRAALPAEETSTRSCGSTRTATSSWSSGRRASTRTTRDAQVERAREAGIDWMVCVGTGLATSQQALDLAGKYDDVYATVGLHPHDASQLDAEWDGLAALADADALRRDRRGGLRPPLRALAA